MYRVLSLCTYWAGQGKDRARVYGNGILEVQFVLFAVMVTKKTWETGGHFIVTIDTHTRTHKQTYAHTMLSTDGDTGTVTLIRLERE